jgi:hypothetical protein
MDLSGLGRFYPFNAFRSLLHIAGDVAAPTYAEFYSGDWVHPSLFQYEMSLKEVALSNLK